MFVFVLFHCFSQKHFILKKRTRQQKLSWGKTYNLSSNLCSRVDKKKRSQIKPSTSTLLQHISLWVLQDLFLSLPQAILTASVLRRINVLAQPLLNKKQTTTTLQLKWWTFWDLRTSKIFWLSFASSLLSVKSCIEWECYVQESATSLGNLSAGNLGRAS